MGVRFLAKVFVAAALVVAGFSAKAADSLTMADFLYTNKLQIAGYTGAETLQNFPVLVRISTSLGDFQYSRMRSTKGGDLAFFALDGTRLASEVDTWTTSGTSLVWVKLPSMAQGTQFYMCYRLTDELAALDTMVDNPNPWGDYVGVWHMRETGTSNPIADSSPNGLDGTTTAGEGVNESNGAIGRARRIAKDNNHAAGIIVDVNSDATKKAVADSLGTDFHASYWMRAQGNVSYSYMLGRRKGDYGYSWGVQFHESNPPSKVRMFSGGNIKTSQDAFAAGEAVLTDAGVGTTLADKTWRKVDVVWKDQTNGGTPAYDFYIDGAFVESKSFPYHVNLEENANIGIGCSTQDSYGGTPVQKGRRLNGDMDEVRLRPGVVNADWIKADYDTVNNIDFVTPAQPEVTWLNGSGSSPGVAYIHHDYVGFEGTVVNCGGFANCSIQCKVWATSGTEPENWTTLTNGLVAAAAFSVSKSGLVPDTAYSYKLRASGGGANDAGSIPVSGSFTTLAGFAVAWSTATEATGLSDIHHDKVVVAGAVATLGDATSFEVQWKCWADGASEPASWTTITNVLGAASFEAVVGDVLSFSTTYNYALRAVANDGETTTPVVGTFTTEPGLTILWSESTGIVQVGYIFVKIGGTVRALGDASSCIVQQKIWAAGESEPDWTTFKTGLGRDDSFTEVVTNLVAGTTYNYKLRADGDDGETTEVVEGTFTTRGDAGETIGSPYTHFFDDGTNSFWVANSFERFLPFTVTGYTGTETLTNFPVLVEVRAKDTNGFSYDDFYRFNGEDIAFVDEKGHIIPHEIDTWNKNGMSLFWVRLPEMNNGTTFTMCYRSPLLDERPDPGNTFERYVGVWHMNERENGLVNLKDSTVNNFETETHAQSTADNNGRIGYARRVAQTPGSSSSYGRIIAFDHDDILRTGVGNVFTFSGWYQLKATPPKWAYLVARKSEDADKGWGIQYDETDATTELRVWSGSSEKNKFQIFKISGMSSTGWNYWTFIYDGSVNPNGTTNQLFHAYLNGEELPTTAGGFQLNYPVVNDENATFDHLCIGGQQNGTGAFNGLVDEARYSKGMRSADWIKAEYNSSLQAVNWNNNNRFVTKGTVSRGTESLVPVVVWEAGSGLPETIIDVSYAYVQFAGTVTFCGTGAETCWIEYQIWADGEEPPGKDDWTILLADATPGTKFSIPVFGLKQDMPYNFRIRAANIVDEHKQTTREHTGSFRTHGNVQETDSDGELLRIDNKFVHLYRAGEYTFTTPDYVTNIEIMVVGGGGAGGYKVGGGGGGGGLFYSQSYPVTTNTTYVVAVGAGGVAASNVTERSGNGQYSTFALESDRGNPLIEVPGGGAGGSYVNNETIAIGSDGASGGGGTYAKMGGLAADDGAYGHDGGRGNDQLQGGSIGKVAAGGGGGAGRAGLGATFDQWSAGGAGGVGVANSMTGEQLFYGAGGGGGYIYRNKFETKNNVTTENFTKPGGGGSGIGGNAADVRNGTPATSGVYNTGAGGGGGSSRAKSDGKTVDESYKTYWKGGDGGDGVALIAYEVHGRDPIAEEPRISMTRCNYVEEVNEEAGNDVAGIAKIDYRLYWAGMQTDLADIYVHYSTVSSNELDSAEGGEWVKVAEASVGIGNLVFTPPAVGYTYWLRLVARKGANSYAHSEELASFTVPAITLNGATWTEGDAPSNDYVTVTYKLYETNEVTHLYCYWSENRSELEDDEPPSGEGVFLLDLGANTNTNLSGKTSFNLPATEGLERNRTYYIRLACGDDQGIKLFPSAEIVELDTKETPSTVLASASWADSNVATVNFSATVGKLDPEEIQLVALYSRVQNDVKGSDPEKKESVTTVSLGFCSDLGLDATSPSATFPLWSDVTTNYYVRLALATNVVVEIPASVVTNVVEEPEGVFTTNIVETAASVVTNLSILAGSYSQAIKLINVSHAVEANTLIYIVTANPKIACYGDAVQPIDYSGPEYAGLTEGWGFENKYGLTGEMACEATAALSSGVYPITQGTLNLENNGDEKTRWDEEEGKTYRYQYKLAFSGATYTITNAVFMTAIDDVVTNYTGEAFDASGLVKTLSGVRNEQPVTYLYRANGAGDWGEMPAFTNVGNYIVQFKASAPNHDDVRSSFKVTVAPAPLTATISIADFPYTGDAQIPAVTTNVTGLVHGDINPLTCQFRDETGEWMDEMPAFTQPGTYKLFFRVSAPNHVTFMTNCTFTIVGWDYMVNMDGTTGKENAVGINVSDPGWLLRAKSITGSEFAEDVYGYLNETQVNGLKLWQNYLIERNDLSRKLVAAIHQNCQRVAENCFELRFPNIDALQNTGLDVLYRVDRKLKGESVFTQGELTDKYEVNVPLGPHDPTGLYVFNMVLVPTNTLYAGQQSVLTSVATVGVLRVSSALTNTVTAVPWLSMSTDSTNEIAIAVADVVNPNGISADDMILAYNSETGDFNSWKHENGDWNTIATVSKKGVSESSAEVARFEPGKAFWLVRTAPGPYIYLIGRYTGEDYLFELEGGSADEPGHTLVANPTMYDVALNDLEFVDDEDDAATPAAGDSIIFQDIAGHQTIYCRDSENKTWGRIVPTKVGRRIKNVWTEDGTNTVGTGFWYMRTDNSVLKIKFGGAR